MLANLRKFKYSFVKYLFNKCFVVSNLCDYDNSSKINSRIEKRGLKLYILNHIVILYLYVSYLLCSVSSESVIM